MIVYNHGSEHSEPDHSPYLTYQADKHLAEDHVRHRSDGGHARKQRSVVYSQEILFITLDDSLLVGSRGDPIRQWMRPYNKIRRSNSTYTMINNSSL